MSQWDSSKKITYFWMSQWDSSKKITYFWKRQWDSSKKNRPYIGTKNVCDFIASGIRDKDPRYGKEITPEQRAEVIDRLTALGDQSYRTCKQYLCDMEVPTKPKKPTKSKRQAIATVRKYYRCACQNNHIRCGRLCQCAGADKLCECTNPISKFE
jgi:hypothetical protein